MRFSFFVHFWLEVCPVGLSFSCRVIAQKQPLVVDHLHTSDSDYEGYMLGGKNGLTIVERLSI
jgi:hypothetical protein